MSQAVGATKVIAFVKPGELQQQITAALESDQEFELVDHLPGPEDATPQVVAAAPDLILIDDGLGGQPLLDLVDELATRFPDIPLIALLDEHNGARAQQYLLAGFRAFLIKPFTQVNLLSSMRRIRELELRRISVQSTANVGQSEKSGPLQILTVYSPRGGVGCSTIAINLAVALQERLDVRVLLMEGKMAFGHLGLMLNSRLQNTIADLIPHAGALDDGLVEEVVAQHASGIYLLLSSPDMNVGQGIRPSELYGVIQAVSRTYDIIVIDAGSHLDDNTVTLMDAADRVLLVTTPDLAALHDTSRFIQLSQSLGFPPNKVLTVLNRAGIRGGIKVGEIEKALRQSLFGRISEGNAKVIRSLNRGVPLLYGSSRSVVSKDIRALAGQLIAVRQSMEGRGSPGTLPTQLMQTDNGRSARRRREAEALRLANR
jgi:pilus assembly protein CpaE